MQVGLNLFKTKLRPGSSMNFCLANLNYMKPIRLTFIVTLQRHNTTFLIKPSMRLHSLVIKDWLKCTVKHPERDKLNESGFGFLHRPRFLAQPALSRKVTDYTDSANTISCSSGIGARDATVIPERCGAERSVHPHPISRLDRAAAVTHLPIPNKLITVNCVLPAGWLYTGLSLAGSMCSILSKILW